MHELCLDFKKGSVCVMSVFFICQWGGKPVCMRMCETGNKNGSRKLNTYSQIRS